MVRNKAFVLRDQKIRIVFPLNQWAVCFTAMNNASPLQTCFPCSLSRSPSCSPLAMLTTVRCLKCFHTCALQNKEDLNPTLWVLHFHLTILPGWLMRASEMPGRPFAVEWDAFCNNIQCGNKCSITEYYLHALKRLFDTVWEKKNGFSACATLYYPTFCTSLSLVCLLFDTSPRSINSIKFHSLSFLLWT